MANVASVKQRLSFIALAFFCKENKAISNQEFYLIDEQKVAYETIKKIINVSLKNVENKNNESGKYTIIIKGGPGTGKSVIAVQLLADLLKEGRSVVYSSKNHTPRDIYFSKLAGSKYKKAYLKSLFLGSGSFVNAKFNQFDCILCDEAHRLNEKSGLYNNLGENQIKEIIRASIVSVFFLDEDQIVTMSDIGSVDQIKEWAFLENSEVICDEDLTLTSQFRCNGSDAYLAFLDNLLEIRKTANEKFDVDYELRLFLAEWSLYQLTHFPLNKYKASFEPQNHANMKIYSYFGILKLV